MAEAATGILTRIQTFLHGLITQPPVAKADDDPFTFFEEVAWLHESERIRQDALVFWESNSHKKGLGRVADLSVAEKFAEKHTLVLSDVELMRLNALAEAAFSETFTAGQRDKAFGPAGAVSEDWIRTDNHHIPLRPVLSFKDPLGNIYEGEGNGTTNCADSNGNGRHNDLYKCIIRMPLHRKIKPE